jgi:hypothetical protein
MVPRLLARRQSLTHPAFEQRTWQGRMKLTAGFETDGMALRRFLR